MGVLAEQPLTRDEEAPLPYPYLTAVGMTGEGEVDAAVGQQIDVHIGLMAKQDFIAVLFKEFREPLFIIPDGHAAEGEMKIPDRDRYIGVLEQNDARTAQELIIAVEELLLMVAEAHVHGSELHRFAQKTQDILPSLPLRIKNVFWCSRYSRLHRFSYNLVLAKPTQS